MTMMIIIYLLTACVILLVITVVLLIVLNIAVYRRVGLLEFKWPGWPWQRRKYFA